MAGGQDEYAGRWVRLRSVLLERLPAGVGVVYTSSSMAMHVPDHHAEVAGLRVAVGAPPATAPSSAAVTSGAATSGAPPPAGAGGLGRGAAESDGVGGGAAAGGAAAADLAPR